MQAGRGAELIEALAETSFHHAHPDHPADVVLERLADSDGLLPVISRENVRRVEGVITLDDVMRALRRRPPLTRVGDDVGNRDANGNSLPRATMTRSLTSDRMEKES